MKTKGVLQVHKRTKSKSEQAARRRLWAKQRRERGFDDRELWNLDDTIATFIIPRIEAFRDMTTAYPENAVSSLEEWKKILTQIADGLKESQDVVYGNSDKVRKALRLLAKHFEALWD